MLVENNMSPVLAAKMRELNPKQKREFEITGLQNESLTWKNRVVNTEKREYKYPQLSIKHRVKNWYVNRWILRTPGEELIPKQMNHKNSI